MTLIKQHVINNYALHYQLDYQCFIWKLNKYDIQNCLLHKVKCRLVAVLFSLSLNSVLKAWHNWPIVHGMDYTI